MLNLIFWTCITTMVLFVPPVLFTLMGIEDLTSILAGRRRTNLDFAEPESELMRDFAKSLQVSPSEDRAKPARHLVVTPSDEVRQEPERLTA